MEIKASKADLSWYHSKKNNANKNISPSMEGIKKKEDILLKYPLRGLAYTNEVGEALRPLSGTLATAMWAPALLYIGADIWDKYSRGRSGDYQEPSRKPALRQAIFQGLASIILPTAAVKAGQKIAATLAGKNVKNIKNVKLIGGFVALACAALPIDHFVQNVVLKKAVDPYLDKIDKKVQAKKANMA